MSHPTTISQPPLEPLTSTPSRLPPPPPAEALAAIDETVRRLRAEAAAATDRVRQARLLTEVADLEERAGDESSAARDYLTAYNADTSSREPLESLLRLVEKRHSLKSLGKLIDALVGAAITPDEKVRALLLRAAFLTDGDGDLAAATSSAREATAIHDASKGERASAWLALEVLAGRTGDGAAREQALGERLAYSTDPFWRALLLVDRARMAVAAGDVDSALSSLQKARSTESQATWTATGLLEQIARERPGIAGTPEAPARAELLATALEAIASLTQDALADGARGDALGVPHWARQRARLVDAWLRAAEARRLAGQIDRATATLDRALDLVSVAEGPDGRLADAIVASARIRIAEQTGDTRVAAHLAERRLATEQNGGLVAALALRIAEHAASEGDSVRAVDALSRAIASDPGSLPARALQLDMLADGGDAAAFAAQLEAFADHLATDEARARAFLLAAYVWSVRAHDVPGAKAALSQAAMFGVSPETTGRLARTLASLAGDPLWYEEATKRLLAAGGTESEAPSLYIELVRLRHARGDAEGAAKALHELAGAPKGAWLARVLEAFLPPRRPEGGSQPAADAMVSAHSRAAVEALASLETDPDLARGLGVVAAMRAQSAGDMAAARARLRELANRDAADSVVTSYLGDLDRAAGDHVAAARTASDAAAATDDPELAGALRLEAGFECWLNGDRRLAVEEMEAALAASPEAAEVALAWATWGLDPDSVDVRRRAIERAGKAGGEPRALAIERFATEVAANDPGAAAEALAVIDRAPEGDLGLAAAIARMAWSGGAADADALRKALARIAASGPGAALLVAAERVRAAREESDAAELTLAAGHWFEAGGGLPAALEWLAAAMLLGDTRAETEARLALASSLTGDGREAMLASAALLEARAESGSAAPLVVGESPAVRLTNLELAPPGCDPRRRAAVLVEIDGALGEDAATDAIGLSGWASLAASNLGAARIAFEQATVARPNDLAAWEGLRAWADRAGDKAVRARAAAALGARCLSAARGAAFWEEAALLWLELGEADDAERALDAGFARDAGRPVAFDKLFRRVRERKDNDKLLALIARRLEATDDATEIQKLFWEQARVLREKGDQDGALKALEHVTMLDPDHVGALALLGEINIRRSNFEEAAESLARLASLETAPAKNRATAGIAAVDLYEKKLDRSDKALEVLLTLHRAKLSNLPVRERLARAAARTGAWTEATAILEELMMERPEAEGRMEAARLAMAIHRDRLGNSQAAAAAIVKLLEEAPTDGEALDMLLQTSHAADVRERVLKSARAALVEGLQKRPTELPLVRRLVRVARALQDDALQQAALGALVALGAADAQAEQAFAQLGLKKPRTPQIAIPGAMLRAILAPGDEGPIADLFVVLGPTLAEALGPNLQACGVGRRDKVDPRSGLALRNEIATWAGAFGVHEFDLYVGGKHPMAVQGVPGDPPALVVGPAVNAPLTPLARGRVVRELLALVRGTTVTRSRDDMTIAAIVVAACKLAEVPMQHPPYAVLAEIERLVGKAISRKTRRMLADLCRPLVSQGADGRTWSTRALASQDRVSTLASGDPSGVLSDVLGISSEKLGEAVPGSPRAEELLRFVLSPQYLDLRRLLGLESAS